MRRLILLLSPIGLLFSPNASAASFIRGDANSDGVVDVTDVRVLFDAFYSGGELDCEDAADANDDGFLDISDPSYVLAYLFWGSAAPPEPFAQAGADPTDDLLTCGDEACDETESVTDNYPWSSNDWAVASDAKLGDLDGDGDLDLVVSSVYTNEFSVRFNAGDGTFGEKVVYESYRKPTRIVLTDVDGDLDLDVVTRNWQACLETEEYSRRYYGTCEGTSSTGRPTLYVGTCSVRETRCAEDALTEFMLFINAGDGSFSEPQDVPTGWVDSLPSNPDLEAELREPYGATYIFRELDLTADLDCNGEDDLVTLNPGRVDSQHAGSPLYGITVTLNGVCLDGDAE